MLHTDVLVDPQGVFILCERVEPNHRHESTHVPVSEWSLLIDGAVVGKLDILGNSESAILARVDEAYARLVRQQELRCRRGKITLVKYNVVISWTAAESACQALAPLDEDA
eukprot:5745874-Prymnesium_polylepis.1